MEVNIPLSGPDLGGADLAVLNVGPGPPPAKSGPAHCAFIGQLSLLFYNDNA